MKQCFLGPWMSKSQALKVSDINIVYGHLVCTFLSSLWGTVWNQLILHRTFINHVLWISLIWHSLLSLKIRGD
jgi:hypothetical protein